MLDRSKIIKELSSRVDGLENILALEHECARALWERVARDNALCEHLQSMPQQLSLPSWTGALGEKKSPDPITEYDVVSIDGSQIYPDRHQGIDCFLINIGACHFKYRAHKSSVVFRTEPNVYFSHEMPECDDSPESINALRTELEFKKGTQWFSNAGQTCDSFPRLLLLDGSLIFWHLHANESSQKSVFLDRYLTLLRELYEQNTLYACYISLPKSREMINVLRAAALLKSGEPIDFNYLLDIDIANFYLEASERSIVLCNHAPVTQRYPEHSKPHFYYVNSGYEMGRVEIPAWIAQDPEKLALVETIINDQLTKGFGYPIALAEAHEQAVITNTDREFFYHALRSLTMHHKTLFRQSQKLMKKQRAGI